MPAFAIQTEADRDQVIRLLKIRKPPFTVSVTKGSKHRTIEQNRLQRLWLLEAEEQGDQTAEEYRAYCKLHMGVPILRAENEEFKKSYDRVIRPLDYELKLLAMMVPLDFPVTRLMKTGQKTRYLDAMYQHFRGLGMELTEPKRG